jgi:hypothetical protein
VIDPTVTIPQSRYPARRLVVAPLTEVAPEQRPANWTEMLPSEGIRPRPPLWPVE